MRLTAALALALLLPGLPALAQKPADKFKGKIVLTTKPFPTRFKSDKAFIDHMRKVDTKSFEYGADGRLNLELMAFFAKPQQGREFLARLFEITDQQRFVLDFPIYPAQDQTRILASGTTLNRDAVLGDDKGDFNQPPARKYLLVISQTANSKVLAETQFVIKRGAADKAADQARLEAQRAAAEKAMAAE